MNAQTQIRLWRKVVLLLSILLLCAANFGVVLYPEVFDGKLWVTTTILPFALMTSQASIASLWVVFGPFSLIVRYLGAFVWMVLIWLLLSASFAYPVFLTGSLVFGPFYSLIVLITFVRWFWDLQLQPSACEVLRERRAANVWDSLVIVLMTSSFFTMAQSLFGFLNWASPRTEEAFLLLAVVGAFPILFSLQSFWLVFSNRSHWQSRIDVWLLLVLCLIAIPIMVEDPLPNWKTRTLQSLLMPLFFGILHFLMTLGMARILRLAGFRIGSALLAPPSTG